VPYQIEFTQPIWQYNKKNKNVVFYVAEMSINLFSHWQIFPCMEDKNNLKLKVYADRQFKLP